MINFNQSRTPGRLFDKGDKVECVNASGTGLTKGAIYVIADTSDCPMCKGGVTLTSGPRPTDVPCGWWRARRFRPIKPPGDELTERIRRARGRPNVAPKTPARELEDA